MPWFSLALGVGGAFWMDRSPRRAGPIAAFIVASWLTLVALQALERARIDRLSQRQQLVVRGARFASIFASEWIIQLTLFFVLPFYARAATRSAGHLGFVALLGCAAALTLWDPLFQALLRRPLTALALQAISSFAGLNALLPILGISNRASLWIGAGAACAGLPLVAAAISPAGARLRPTLAALAVGALFPLAVLLGAGRVVPAAPLRLVEIGLGTRLADRALLDQGSRLINPEQLVCLTAVFAPRGLHDELFHAWSQEGRPMGRVPLAISGGRERGFRTWSIKKILGQHPAGRWRCVVETASGQVLGDGEVDVVLALLAKAPVEAAPAPAFQALEAVPAGGVKGPAAQEFPSDAGDLAPMPPPAAGVSASDLSVP